MTDLTRIDDGPVATVYAGHRAGVPVAVKVFPKRFDKRTMSAFTKEQAKLSTVRRITSILMVDGVEEMPSGESALRMELCTQSLANLVDRVGPLAAADVAILGRAMATALAAAHSVGVAHGGVSPHNVLFRENNEPVVADFGITLRQAFTRDPLHAIEYLPPETLRTGTLNELTDLYGLGAVLHFALTARSPHPGRLGEQPGERVLRILGEPVPAINRSDVPIGLSTLVARLLATTPDRRPQDAGQVADQLTAMLPNPPTPTPTEDWDDFDQPSPPSLPALPEDPLDFDDFAPGSTAWAPRRPAPPPPPQNGRPPVRPVPMEPPSPDASSLAMGASPASQVQSPPQAATWPPPGPLAASVEAMAEPPTVGASAEAPVPPTEAVTPPGPVPAPSAHPSLSPTPLLPLASPPIPVRAKSDGVLRPPAPDHPWLPNAPADSSPTTDSPTADGPTSADPIGHPPPAEPGDSLPPIDQDESPSGVVATPSGDPAEEPAPAEPVRAVAGAEQGEAALPPDGGDAPATVEFSLPRQPGVMLGGNRRELEFDDGFGDDFGNGRRATVLAGPLTPPEQSGRRLVRYDLLAGIALLLALLALVPLLLLRGDPDEMSSTPKVPTAGGAGSAGDVTVELAQPTDLTDKVQLNWKATRDLDFAVVVAAEGESTRVLLAERNHSMTVEVEPGLKYCFLVQASDGDRVYESEPQPLRGATCRK